MPLPRILTFNFHEPYLCLMAKTGLPMDVGLYTEEPLARVWQTRFRPVPGNLRFVEEGDWRGRAMSGWYDVIIAQNEMNSLDVAKSPSPKLLLFHNRRNYMETTAHSFEGDPVEAYGRLLEILCRRFDPVYISETKRDSYGIPGRVIFPGIDMTEYHGYTGEVQSVLRVGNNMRARSSMFDVDFQEAVCEGFATTVLGVNPQIPGARESNDFADYRDALRKHRCILHVSREGFEDGYNLALLEGMATGMPVVSLANPTSPILDGVNGFASYDVAELRERVAQLMADPELARRLGAKARETVAERFPMERFIQGWRDAIYEAADSRLTQRAGQPIAATANAKVLLHYISNPLTTGRWVEPALRERAQVVTAGFRLPEGVLHHWGFSGSPKYGKHEVDLPFDAPYAEMLAQLPRRFKPNTYLYIDSGQEEMRADIDALPITKVAWLIDTHVSPEIRLAIARHFDHVFLAQKAQVEPYRQAGLKNVHWLPLGCSPDLHAVPMPGRTIDVAYVGSFNPEEGGRRRDVLTAVQRRFPNSYIGKAWPDEMASIYARSKIVVNAAFRNDVNMRVFEAMASGALLITDEAEGLSDLFEEGRHLVVYRNDAELCDLVQHYLDNEDARERIAAEGQREVLACHTYGCRVDELLAYLEKNVPDMSKPVVEHEVKHDTYYQHVRRELFPFVPMKTRRLLDIGCGAGAVASTLKRERGLDFVAGVEIVEEAYLRAKEVLDAAYLANIEETDLPFAPASFDCIICADVLEHLVEPEVALGKLGELLTEEGVVVISLPNARFHDTLAMVSQGYWTYVPEGIMDSTHLRWFTRKNIPAFVKGAGLELLHYQPLSILDSDRLPISASQEVRTGKLTLTGVTEEDYEELRTYQHLVVVGKPHPDRLAKARAAIEAGEYEAAYAHAADALGADDRARVMLMAKALGKLGRLQDAEALYRNAIKLERDPEASAEYGILLLAMNDIAGARPHLERAVAALPHPRARGALGLVCLNSGEYARAFDLLAEAADASFDHDSLISPLVAAADGSGRLEEALPIIERYCEFYPANPALGCALAATLIALERLPEAKDRLETILMFHPDHADARALLDSLLRHGDATS
jgi:glycosyltransferase involved in cell wall biosynthesis/SAM-dependent methyltransferase